MLDDAEKCELPFDEDRLRSDGHTARCDGEDSDGRDAVSAGGAPLSRNGCQRSHGFDAEAQRPRPEVEEVCTPLKVARSRRRGLLGKYTLLAEVVEPKDYPNSTKWFITFVVAVAAMAAPMGSAILFPSLIDISTSLDTTPTITNLSVGFYMLSLAIFPLFWSSFCETSGRRSIYLISFALALLFNVLSAVSTNVAMFVIMRILAGGASASVQVVGAGTIADVWHVRERGKAMGIFYLGPLMGPLLAPIIGGALQLRWGWRSIMWFLVIYTVITLNLLMWCLPETLSAPKVAPNGSRDDDQGRGTVRERRSNLSRATSIQSVQSMGARAAGLVKRTFIDPFKVVRHLRFPAVALTVYYASITFGSLYVLQVSVQATFGAAPYHFTALQIGLAYLFNSVGYLLASIFGGRWTDVIMAREARRAGRYDEKGRLMYQPEDRMRENAWVAALMYPTALIWYGWTAEKHVYWAVSLVANFFFGVGSMLVFGMATTMLTEFMPKKASSGIAINNFCRNMFACIGGIVSEPLINAIGNGWLFTGLGVIAGASSVVVWAMKRYGPRWRKAMDERMD